MVLRIVALKKVLRVCNHLSNSKKGRRFRNCRLFNASRDIKLEPNDVVLRKLELGVTSWETKILFDVRFQLGKSIAQGIELRVSGTSDLLGIVHDWFCMFSA